MLYFCFHIYGIFIILCTKHNCKVSASFVKEKESYECLKTAKLMSILLLALAHLLTVISASVLYLKPVNSI